MQLLIKLWQQICQCGVHSKNVHQGCSAKAATSARWQEKGEPIVLCNANKADFQTYVTP